MVPAANFWGKKRAYQCVFLPEKMLPLASLDMHFIFNGTLYKQVDGVAMGSPLGPTLANAFMCYWEESDCPASFKPLTYHIYVDDIFLIFSPPEHPALFLEYLNSQQPNIKLTCEIEHSRSLPFLDVNITRGDSKLSTSLYHKPTFTGLLTKFSAFSPMLYKKNLIATRNLPGLQNKFSLPFPSQ